MKKQQTIELKAYAKVNLFLRITGKREDGYHFLRSLMCRISICDTINISIGGQNPSQGISIECNHPLVPSDQSNLVCKAVDLFYRRLGQNNPGVHILLDKNIPVAAGLGGGSSDAATVLVGLNRRHGAPFSMKALMNMGLKIGADVPFFIFGRPALASGIGEQLAPYDGLRPWSIVLINPGFSVSTAMVYKNLNLRLTKCKKKFIKTNFKGFRFVVPDHLCNDLETVTAKEFPELSAAKEALMMYGAEGSLMSGSGPTVFGLFTDEKTAKEAGDGIAHHHKMKTYVAELIV